MRQPLYARKLTTRESRELLKLIRSSPDAQVVRRAQVIRLSARGKTPRQIADLLDRSWSGVRKIINRFNTDGFASLADKRRVGRPRKRTDRYVALLKEAVQANPRDMGYPFSCWTLERLREHLARRTKIILSPPHLSRLLHENNIVYRRPKHGMGHLRDEAEYNQKKAFLEFVKKGPCIAEPSSICSTSMSVRFTSTRP
jgi:transposase